MTKDIAHFLKNETIQSIVNRRSIRLFTERPVSEEDIMTILHAANQAPSAHNLQSWHFIVVSGDKKKDLAHLVLEKARNFPRASGALLRMAARTILGASRIIAVANTGDLISRGTKLFKLDKKVAHDFFRTMEIQSSAAAVENMLLAARSLGLGSVWLGILYLIKDDVLQFLGEPKGEFMAVVPVGYAAKQSKGPKKVPVEEVVRYVR